MRKNKLSIFLLISLSLTANAASVPAPLTCSLTARELGVYKAFFRNWNSPIVLVSRTAVAGADLADVVQLATGIQGTPKDVRDDFRVANEAGCYISSADISPNVRTITPREQADLFNSDRLFTSDDGWQVFHKRFGKSAMLVEVSKIGFDKTGCLAMFHVSSSVGWMGGGGELYVYHLKDGKWLRKSSVVTFAT
jgi:hypothetical protein